MMDFEFDGNVALWTGVFWLLTLVLLWRFSSWQLFQKVMITLFSLPMYYLVISKMAS